MSEALETEEKRGPGRPPKNEAPVKKGKPTWRPANIDEVVNKEAGYRYRWCRKDQDNLAKKEAEQWEVDQSATVIQGYGRTEDGKPLTSVKERRDAILMRIPEDVALERDAYVNQKTGRSIEGLRQQTKDELRNSSAPVHGGISMEKRGVRTIIKE